MCTKINLKNVKIAAAALCCSLFFYSCMSVKKTEVCSRNLSGKGIKDSQELSLFFTVHNPDCDKEYVKKLAELYISESEMENINSDAAFVQMCLETGFLTFGNLVVPEMNNFCGLGAMDEEHPGEWFINTETGVRAHIQHLQAYATTEDVELHNPLVDPRYSWPHKAKNAQTVFDLAGSWAADKEYGLKLDNLLTELEMF